MADLLWYFWIYSFLGCLVEKAFAAAVRAERRERKCLLLLPLCPVYGLAMAAVLAAPESWRQGPWLVAVGAVSATAVEYAVHWAGESLLGVRFWDYTHTPANLGGRICLPFSLAWGPLAAAAVWLVHPVVESLVSRIPPAATYGVLLLFTADAVCTVQFLRTTHDLEGLRATGWAF